MDRTPASGSGIIGAVGYNDSTAGGRSDDDAPSALFLALQNPSLSTAAAVLLRTMSETGTISSEDARLMSSFLESCEEQDARERSAGGRVAGSKRQRNADKGDDSDEVQAAAAARTVTAQLPECEWVSQLRGSEWRNLPGSNRCDA